MDDPTTVEARSYDALARRRRMRDTARADAKARRSRNRPQYQTPQWLDRSFVLPLSGPGVSAMPAQPLPHHDDLAHLVESAPATAPGLFVRPPSKEIDFARVIRRAEGARHAGRTAVASTGITGLAVLGYLITGSSVALAVMLVAAVLALVALAVGRRLSAAPIPHLEV